MSFVVILKCIFIACGRCCSGKSSSRDPEAAPGPVIVSPGGEAAWSSGGQLETPLRSRGRAELRPGVPVSGEGPVYRERPGGLREGKGPSETFPSGCCDTVCPAERWPEEIIH